MIRIGTTGWSLPTQWQDYFPEGKTHLHSYADVFDAVEISRTFRKMPLPSTLQRWAESVPPSFRFSLKLPKVITHEERLRGAGPLLDEFLLVASQLGDRLGPLLVQLPPTLAFEPGVARAFLEDLRLRREGPDVLEARHESWFAPEVDHLLVDHAVARVAADPPRGDRDGRPGGHRGLAYFRLHGSPELYYSAYRGRDLEAWAERVKEARQGADDVWCVFDNTGRGEGTADALALRKLFTGLGTAPAPPRRVVQEAPRFVAAPPPS